MTTWDYHTQPRGRPPQVADHRPLLADAGLETLAYDESSQWRQTMIDLDRLAMEAVDEFAEESGEHPDVVRRGLEEAAATMQCMIRRALFVAARRLPRPSGQPERRAIARPSTASQRARTDHVKP